MMIKTNDDYISREAALIKVWRAHLTKDEKERLMEEIKSIFTADVRPVVRARWEWKNTDALASFAWTCSACGQRKVFKTNFCPSCGAEMTGGADNG